jgi:hypothetical protein
MGGESKYQCDEGHQYALSGLSSFLGNSRTTMNFTSIKHILAAPQVRLCATDFFEREPGN